MARKKVVVVPDAAAVRSVRTCFILTAECDVILQPCFESSASTKQKRVYFSLCYNSQVKPNISHPPTKRIFAFFPPSTHLFFPKTSGETRLYQRRNNLGEKIETVSFTVTQ